MLTLTALAVLATRTPVLAQASGTDWERTLVPFALATVATVINVLLTRGAAKDDKAREKDAAIVTKQLDELKATVKGLAETVGKIERRCKDDAHARAIEDERIKGTLKGMQREIGLAAECASDALDRVTALEDALRPPLSPPRSAGR